MRRCFAFTTKQSKHPGYLGVLNDDDGLFSPLSQTPQQSNLQWQYLGKLQSECLSF